MTSGDQSVNAASAINVITTARLSPPPASPARAGTGRRSTPSQDAVSAAANQRRTSTRLTAFAPPWSFAYTTSATR